MNKPQIAFEVIQDLLVSAALTVTALLVSKAPLSALLLLKEICFAWAVNMVIGFLLPEKRIGEALAEKLRLKGFAAHLLIMLVIVVINVLGISACVVLKNVGFKTEFLSVWSGLLPVLLLVGYPAALIFFPFTRMIVGGLFKEKTNPEEKRHE